MCCYQMVENLVIKQEMKIKNSVNLYRYITKGLFQNGFFTIFSCFLKSISPQLKCLLFENLLIFYSFLLLVNSSKYCLHIFSNFYPQYNLSKKIDKK